MNTRTLIERARAAAHRPRHELDALGVAPLDDAERAALRELLRFVERFNCVAHVRDASDADRARLAEIIEATGKRVRPYEGQHRPEYGFDNQAYDTAAALRSQFAKPAGDGALVRDLRSRGYRL